MVLLALGGSQSDVAHLKAEDVDWRTQVASFFRAKNRDSANHSFWSGACRDVARLAGQGLLVSRTGRHGRKTSCGAISSGLAGAKVSLASHFIPIVMPGRNARKWPVILNDLRKWHLGHNSKAIHRAYARNAQVILPPLEDYERKIVPLNIHAQEIVANMPMKEVL